MTTSQFYRPIPLSDLAAQVAGVFKDSAEFLPRTIEELLSGQFPIYNLGTAIEAFYERIRIGDINRLMDIPATPDNGREIIRNLYDYVGINLLAVVTDFVSDAVLAEYPDVYDYHFWAQLEESIKTDSCQGKGVLITEPGAISSIPSYNYRKLLDGHAILYPRSTNNTLIPDKVDIHILNTFDGTSKGFTFELSGSNIKALLDVYDIELNGVFTFGDGKSDYVDLVPVVREFVRRVSFMSRTLTRIGNPSLLMDHAAIAVLETGGQKFEYNPAGMLIPTSAQGAETRWLQYDPTADAVQMQIELMIHLFHSITGIPQELLHPSYAQSGISLERQMLRMMWRIKKYQRDLTMIVREAAPLIGLPVVDFEWPDNLAVLRETSTNVPTVDTGEAETDD